MNDRELEAALERWAKAPSWDEAAIERIESHGDALARPNPVRRWWPAMAGAALAASVAAMVLIAPRPATAPAPEVATITAADPDASFALLYTPTTEEELLF